MARASQVSPTMRKLSNYIATALQHQLPANVTERAKIHLLDTFAAMISGSRLLPGKLAISYVKQLAGKAEAGVIGTRLVTSAFHAAFTNGMCGHADETDDTHPPSRSHPGVIVIPAVLAIAERQKLSGSALLRAQVLGYDICARILLTLTDDQLRGRGQHGGSKGGLFGAAAGAAALLGLSATQIRYVLSYCAQQAGGVITTLRETEHVEKASTHCGMPSHNAIVTCLMVKSGFTGVDDVFSGEPNFLSIFSKDADPAMLVRGLGRDFEILRGGIKRWPAGGPIQGPLQVLHELIRTHGIKAGDVEKLVVRIPDKELKVVDDREMADISVQHLLAVTLVDGSLSFAAAHDHVRIKDSRVRQIKRRIHAVGDPRLTDVQRRWRCAMEVYLKDGRTLRHETMAAKGTFENPLTWNDEQEKASDLIGPILGKKRTDALIRGLFDIERIKDVRKLRMLYAI